MNKETLNILMVEDSELDAELNQEQLSLLKEYDCKTKVIQDKDTFINEITLASPPDLILCDYNLPMFNGIEALMELKVRELNIPFIFVTGAMQEEVAADAIKAGAWDYVVKDRLFRLPLAIKGVLKLKQEKDMAFEAEKRTQTLLRGIEETSMQVLVLNKDFTIEYANRNFIKKSGLTEANVVGESIFKFYPDGNVQLKEHLKKVLESRVIHTGDELVSKNNGKEIWERYSITPVFGNLNENKGWIIIKDDISKQKRIENNLRETKERYDLATRIGEIGTWDWDISKGNLIWNDQTYNILGLSPGEVKPSYELFISLIHEDDKKRLEDALKGALEDKKPYSIDCRIVLQSGECRFCNSTGKVSFNENNEPVRMLGIIIDITERKIAEDELRKAKQKAEESDKLKTAFLANLSHEIRTPMNGILGFADLIKSRNLTPELINSYIDIIEQSGERMLNLINDLVDISKIEADLIVNEPELTNLNKLLDELYQFYYTEVDKKGLVLSCEKGLDDAESDVLIDKTKLEQVLSNLLSNALKFTKYGSISIDYKIENEMLVFRVKDTGIGVPDNRKDIIFERFGQVEDSYLKEAEGMGLGLSISRSFIEKMGGKIWLETEFGKGSEFFITLPYNPNNNTQIENTDVQEPEFEKEMAVLLAEDDEISYLYIHELFDNKNIKLFRAENGAQAIETFNEHPEIQLILMDLKMPGMSGIEATKEIRKNNALIPIIAVTAYALEGEKQNALNAGCTDVITKPVDKDILQEKMAYYLDSH